MKILVTGANGLVGRHLLTRPDIDFFAATRRPPAAGIWLETDLASDFDTSHFPRELDAVIYLAQSNRYRDLPDGAADLIDVNVAGVTRMLQYAASLESPPQVIIASTGDVYGRSTGSPFSENDPLFQNIGTPGLYPLSRKIAEDFAVSIARIYGLRLTIVRLFHIYGQGMPEYALISRLMHSIQEGRAIRLEGENGIYINPTYVTDVVDALLRTVSQKPENRGQIEIYNIAASQTYSLRQIAEVIAGQGGQTPVFEVAAPHPAPYIVPSVEKFAAHYGAMRTLSFEEGFKRLYSQR